MRSSARYSASTRATVSFLLCQTVLGKELGEQTVEVMDAGLTCR